MRLSAFKLSVPPKLIAPYPAEHRDEARLMVIHKNTGQIEHKVFTDLLHYLGEDDSLVLNDTRVLPTKLQGRKEKTAGNIEVILLRELDEQKYFWDAQLDPARKVRGGNKLCFGNGELVAEVLDNTTSRGRTLKFLFEGTREELYSTIARLGTVPLPKQLKRTETLEDLVRYQTVYAQHDGALVAPAAGLHFTAHLLKRLALKGVNTVFITLHTAISALNTIDIDDLVKYKVGSEPFVIPEETASSVNKSRDSKQQICAVGISTLKTIEAYTSLEGRLKAGKGWINRLIAPPYTFKTCKSLITNFHLPASIPLVTTAAFGGHELIMEAYKIAIKEQYRFFVYGDAMLII